jgi:hypothetical protein
MDINRALLITKDRIGNLKGFTPSNRSEACVVAETLEYLEFVEKILEKEKEDEQSRTLEH